MPLVCRVAYSTLLHNDPDLTSRGKIPDKEAALVVLHDLLGLDPYIPRGLGRVFPVDGARV